MTDSENRKCLWGEKPMTHRLSEQSRLILHPVAPAIKPWTKYRSNRPGSNHGASPVGMSGVLDQPLMFNARNVYF